MKLELIRQLQEIKLFEEDLFPNATPSDIKAREVERRKIDPSFIEEGDKVEVLRSVSAGDERGYSHRARRGQTGTVTQVKFSTVWVLLDDSPRPILLYKDLVRRVMESKINEEDLFPNATPEEVEAKKKELRDTKESSKSRN